MGSACAHVMTHAVAFPDPVEGKPTSHPFHNRRDGSPWMGRDVGRRPNGVGRTMEPEARTSMLRFQPMSSAAVEPSFWIELYREKLQVHQLSEVDVPVSAYVQPATRQDLPCTLRVDPKSLTEGFVKEMGILKVPGMLLNFNTASKFSCKEAREEAFRMVVDQIWDDIRNGAALGDPTKLLRFLLLAFADLKTYKFHYWFAFPALKPPENFQATRPVPFRHLHTLSQDDLDRFAEFVPQFAWILHFSNEDEATVAPLSELISFREKTGTLYVAHIDPSLAAEAAGWTLRNLLLLLQCHLGYEFSRILSVRFHRGRVDIDSSLVFDVRLLTASPRSIYMYNVPAVGWEKNHLGKLQPRRVDLSSSMDPKKMAASSVDLNLRLMRWRAVPSLDIDAFSKLRCLIIGAGTLGCTVARSLIGWGVRQITFIDGGRISYSNPSRQSLFTFQDCLEGGRSKAEAAAARLKDVFPGVVTRGIAMTVPMPGHFIVHDERNGVVESINRLDELVQASDVVFILTDTRESRWLPTLLATTYNKVTINSALGFDTFLVIRHGQRPSIPPESRLACYFCSDVIAPVNSTEDRTLDQQCTVTRPGLATIAGALAVELMASVVSHPSGIDAPVDTARGNESIMSFTESSSPLGLVPHSIRGCLRNFAQQNLASTAFPNCCGCSYRVVEEYEKHKHEFILSVLDNPSKLEELTGLSEIHAAAEAADVEWDIESSDTGESQE